MISEFLRSSDSEGNLNRFFQEIERKALEKQLAVFGESVRDVFITSRSMPSLTEGTYLTTVSTTHEVYAGGALPVARSLAGLVGSVVFISNAIDPEPKFPSNLYFKKMASFEVIKRRYVDDVTGTVYHYHSDLPVRESRGLGIDLEAISMAEGAHAVVVLDYGHGLLSTEMANRLRSTAAICGATCQINEDNYPFNLVSKYHDSDLLLVNAEEARLNLVKRDKSNALSMAQELRSATGANRVIVADGAKGAGICDEQIAYSCGARRGPIVDTVGCSEIMLGVRTLALACGLCTEDILILGSFAAAAKTKLKVHDGDITWDRMREVAIESNWETRRE